jgi:S-adenosylmethionine hydrolase
MSTPARPLVVLLTDFGLRDGYAGVLEGVLAQRCPDVQCITLSHEIPAQNVDAAAFVLWNSYRCFPTHAVFLCVVDPGVGTARARLALRLANGQHVVAPDNGLVRFAVHAAGATQGVMIDPAALALPAPSATFEGRDVLAPAAAALAAGAALHALGAPVDPATRAEDICMPADAASARIVFIDHFGNLITNIPACVTPASVQTGGVHIRRRVATYAAAPDGELVLLPGSSGFWEIALKIGAAHARLPVACGAPVTVTR